MQREDDGGEKRTGNREPPKNDRQQPGRRGVENDVYEVIPDRGMTPQLVHEPERGMGQRIVLLRGTNVEPNKCHKPVVDCSSGRVR